MSVYLIKSLQKIPYVLRIYIWLYYMVYIFAVCTPYICRMYSVCMPYVLRIYAVCTPYIYIYIYMVLANPTLLAWFRRGYCLICTYAAVNGKGVCRVGQSFDNTVYACMYVDLTAKTLHIHRIYVWMYGSGQPWVYALRTGKVLPLARLMIK
jgi:hypothetical protein